MSRTLFSRFLPLVLAWSTAPSLARADDLPLDEILKRARVVSEKKPSGTVCHLRVATQLSDKAGKVEHDEVREGTATLTGDDQEDDFVSVIRDGKPMGKEELATERTKVKKQQKERKKDEVELSPLAPKNADAEKFELVGNQTLWGRPVYVIKVHADGDGGSLANGTLWIDRETFVEVKGELEPARMPPHADWVKVQEQFALDGHGVPIPSLLNIQGAGHMFFVHKQFRSTLRWSDCH
ncbi:MAG TPA: hypothetical protein VIA18_26845 [Polyangia bacterium]|jgi:hypothetical protein|nr:hypothetical protein [Polyangia bacterium]HWE29788.1 hypothetical protein [Polyangia bacterium]